MSERTDHAAEARKRVQWVNEWQEREGDIPETHLADALVAQAHATLALARQQQIANLIALGSLVNRDLTHEELEEASYGALDVLLDTVQTGPDDEHVVLAPDIAADLGIKVQP